MPTFPSEAGALPRLQFVTVDQSEEEVFNQVLNADEDTQSSSLVLTKVRSLEVAPSKDCSTLPLELSKL
jgi:hypothetical protein